MKSFKSIIAVVVLAAMLFAIPAQSAVPVFPQTQTQQAQSPVVHHIPVLIRDGRIYVYANVGIKKALLLIDSGAQVSTFKLKLTPPHQGVVPVAVRITTAVGSSDCVRLETSVDLVGFSDSDIDRTLVAGIFGPFEFGNGVDGLLGADVLLNGRYSSVAFDLEHNEMLLTEKVAQ